MLAVGAAATGSALAQSSAVSPTAAQRCLTRGELTLGTPKYPDTAYQVRAKGRVTVELEFSAPDAPPKVVKLEAKSEDGSRHATAFERAVEEFIAAYRIPCLPPGEKSRLTQEFAFEPFGKRDVTYIASFSADEQRADKFRGCVKHLTPDKRPEYPHADLRAERQGTAVVRAVFKDGANAPAVNLLDEGGSRWFGETGLAHAQGFRMPCHDGAGAVEFVFHYQFKIEGGNRVALTDAPLNTWVRYFKGYRDANVYFDTNTMGCPFEVDFTLMQPYSLNRVGEIGKANPERRFLLDWLTRQQFDFPAPSLNRLLGQRAVLTVPCMVLDVGGRSGGGASK
jgi:hypothetical protein